MIKYGRTKDYIDISNTNSDIDIEGQHEKI